MKRSAASPAWTYLPVDDLSIPVAGLTCLGSLERTHMTYELTGSGFSGFRGFGVDEFAQTKNDIAIAAAKAAAAKKASTSTIGFKLGSPTIKGLSPIKQGVTAQPAPVLTGSMPTIVPGMPITSGEPGCSPGYAVGPQGTCVPEAQAYAVLPEDDTTTKYLLAGGLVVALGTAAFFLTRKGKLSPCPTRSLVSTVSVPSEAPSLPTATSRPRTTRAKPSASR